MSEFAIATVQELAHKLGKEGYPHAREFGDKVIEEIEAKDQRIAELEQMLATVWRTSRVASNGRDYVVLKDTMLKIRDLAKASEDTRKEDSDDWIGPRKIGGEDVYQ